MNLVLTLIWLIWTDPYVDPPGDLAAVDPFSLAVINDLSYNLQSILSERAAADLLR